MEVQKSCKSCDNQIIDGQAYKLGSDQWHVDCFKCSKCEKTLGVNSNFLVLGTGALVCSDCSYTCKTCNKKIYDLAILTGDLAYCADCFKCKSCKKPIDDLKYARTSKGLFCMPCHHMLMAKKKKYELQKLKKAKGNSLDPKNKGTNEEDIQKKKQLLQEKQEELRSKKKSDKTHLKSPKLIAPFTFDNGTSQNSASDLHSKITNESLSSTSTFDINDYSIPTPKDQESSNVGSFDEKNSSIEILSLPLVAIDNKEKLLKSNDDSHLQSLETSETSRLNSNLMATPVLTSNKEEIIVPVRSPRRQAAVLSPVKKTSQYRTPELSTPSKRNNIVEATLISPNSANRQGFVISDNLSKEFEQEPESFINLDDETEEEIIMDSITDPKLMSPIKPSAENQTSEFSSKNSDVGLNIVMDSDFKSNEKSFIFGGDQNQSNMRTPTYSGSHQRSISTDVANDIILEESPASVNSKKKKGSGLGRSFTKVFQRSRKSSHDYKDIKDYNELIGTPETLNYKVNETPQSKHSRNMSDHSVTAYSTPPLASQRLFHNRSTSETNTIDGLKKKEDNVGIEMELRFLKSEIATLTISKGSIIRDIQSLQKQKKELEVEVSSKMKAIKDLDNILEKKNQALKSDISLDSYVKEDFTSTNSSTSRNESREDLSTSELINNVVASTQKSQSNLMLNNLQSQQVPGKSRGFMRRFFGSNQGNTNGIMSPPVSAASTSGQTVISKPMNPMHGDEAIYAINMGKNGTLNGNMKVSQSYHENLDQNGQSFIKSSKSTNFIKNNLLPPGSSFQSMNSHAVSEQPVGSKLYSMTIQELAIFEGNQVPFIIDVCMKEVANRGSQSEGIYRISASTSNVDNLEQMLETLNIHDASEVDRFHLAMDGDINAAAGLLKRYLKKIPDPLIPKEHYGSFVQVGITNSDNTKMKMLKDIIGKSPKTNQIVLYLLADHLTLISENEKWTKMNQRTLATVFAPTLIRDDEMDPYMEVRDNKPKTEATEYLFYNYKAIFEGII
ncbi:GTPase-activating protein [Martiniozyma asiatica (nom. inval.)]|nr:GTPase-activating protein [Martiniozyma asiatica]